MVGEARELRVYERDLGEIVNNRMRTLFYII